MSTGPTALELQSLGCQLYVLVPAPLQPWEGCEPRVSSEWEAGTSSGPQWESLTLAPSTLPST